MRQTRFNNKMVCHVHKCHTDRLSLIDIANDFVDNNKKETDRNLKPSSVKSKGIQVTLPL